MKDKVQPEIDELDGPRMDDKKRDDLGRLQFSLGKRPFSKKYIKYNIWQSILNEI